MIARDPGPDAANLAGFELGRLAAVFLPHSTRLSHSWSPLPPSRTNYLHSFVSVHCADASTALFARRLQFKRVFLSSSPAVATRIVPPSRIEMLPLAKAVSTPVNEPSLLRPLDLITPRRPLQSYSRAQIAFLISQGHLILIHRGFVYRLNSFLAS